MSDRTNPFLGNYFDRAASQPESTRSREMLRSKMDDWPEIRSALASYYSGAGEAPTMMSLKEKKKKGLGLEESNFIDDMLTFLLLDSPQSDRAEYREDMKQKPETVRGYVNKRNNVIDNF